eukprot:2255751-Prymnesium_polylepis.1
MSCRHTHVGQDCGLRGARAVCWTVDWGAGIWWDMVGYGVGEICLWRDIQGPNLSSVKRLRGTPHVDSRLQILVSLGELAGE